MEGANLTHWEVAWMGLKMLPKECYKYGQEWREHFRPKVYDVEHGCYLYQWRFQSQEDVDQWVRVKLACLDKLCFEGGGGVTNLVKTGQVKALYAGLHGQWLSKSVVSETKNIHFSLRATL